MYLCRTLAIRGWFGMPSSRAFSLSRFRSFSEIRVLMRLFFGIVWRAIASSRAFSDSKFSAGAHSSFSYDSRISRSDLSGLGIFYGFQKYFIRTFYRWSQVSVMVGVDNENPLVRTFFPWILDHIRQIAFSI